MSFGQMPNEAFLRQQINAALQGRSKAQASRTGQIASVGQQQVVPGAMSFNSTAPQLGQQQGMIGTVLNNSIQKSLGKQADKKIASLEEEGGLIGGLLKMVTGGIL